MYQVSNQNFSIYRKGIGFVHQRNHLYNDYHFLLYLIMKTKKQILLRNSLNAVKDGLINALKTFKQKFSRNEFYIFMEDKDIIGDGIHSETYSFKDPIENSVMRFIQMIENMRTRQERILGMIADLT